MRLRVDHQHSRFLSILTCFVDYYSPFWGPEAISIVVELPGVLTCWSSTITVWANSGPFLGLLLYFGVSESFPRLMNTGVRLRVGHQHSHIRPILVCFMHYYSGFWGPRAISTIDDPQVEFTCPSSTLKVLANSDPFRGLLLTVLGSQSDFHGCRTPRCAYVSVIKTASVDDRLISAPWVLITIEITLGPQNGE